MSMRIVVSLVVAAALPPGRVAAQKLSATKRAELVARVWSEARRNSVLWSGVRADMDSALAESLRRAALPQTDLRFWRLLDCLTALLGDGQAAVVPPSGLRSRLARPPLALTSVEGHPFLIDYAPNDEMRVARPERLAEIVTVQGVPADDWIRDSILPEIGGATAAARWEGAVRGMLRGLKGSSLQLVLRLPGGEQRGVSVTRSVSLTERWPLDPPAVEIDSLPDGIVVARVNRLDSHDVVEQFDRALPVFTGLRGLILDVRTAAGGRQEYGYQILARLTVDPFATIAARTSQYRPGLRIRGAPDSAMSWYPFPLDTVVPRSDRPAYAGPIAVLSSTATSGAAEDLLAAFRNTGRGIIIGTTSAGSPGEPLEIPLLEDWSLRLSVVREAFPGGGDFTGTGVAPELPVVQTVADLLAGRDAALERARGYLAAQRE